MKKTIFLMLFLICSIGAMAQTKSINGVVTDATGETIIGASVVEAGTTNGTITDLDGKFVLTVPASGTKISVSYIGFTTQTISVGASNTYNVVLKEDSKVLDEVVITAYGGKQLKTKLTNSISKVGEGVLTSGMHTNPAKALAGAVSGLRVQQTNGSPGDVPTITLRGGTNMDGSGSPLVIVDGQVRDNLGDINPEDIASMEVMKDAGATAIYGARANNGVILITTKRGKEGFTEIRVKAKVGFNYFRDNWNFLDGGDYIKYQRTAVQRAANMYQTSDGTWKGITNMSSLTTANPYGTGNIYYNGDGSVADGNKDSKAVWSTMKYTDDLAFLLNKGWKTMIDPVYGDNLIYKEFMLRDTNVDECAVTQDYNVSLSGGNDKGKYYANFGYNDSQGNAVGNWYKRFSFTLNADYKIRKWLTSQSSISFIDTKSFGVYGKGVKNEIDINNYFGRSLSVPPTFRGVNESGDYLYGVRGIEDMNKLINLDAHHRDNNRNKFNMAQSFVIDIIDGLSLKLNGIWYINEVRNEAFNKTIYEQYNVIDSSRESYAKLDRTMDQTYNAVLSYDKQLTQEHYVSAMAGFEYYDSYNKGFDAYGKGAATDDFADLELTQKDGRQVDSWHKRERIMSVFGRANYDYLSKYLISFVIRRDGYSKLIDNRWGVFPGISGGWVFSKEKFMEPLQDVISLAKVRASYGLNGNVSGIGYYDLQGKFANYSYNNSLGYLIGYDNDGKNITGLSNPGLRWEKSHTFEAGLDLAFLNSKYTVGLTYYQRRTKDKLEVIALPSHSGLNTFLTNNGELQNQGLEVDINARIIATRDWNLSVNLNGAYNQNKIISLPNNGLSNNRQEAIQVYSGRNKDELIWVGGKQEGGTFGDIYGFKALGIYNSYDEIRAAGITMDKSTGNNGSNNKVLYGPDEWAAKTDAEKVGGLPIQPGDVKWLDVNGDNVIDDFDRVKLGNKLPTVTGGFTINLGWKKLTLMARMDYALGHTVVDTRTPWMLGNMQGSYNTIDLVKEAWTPETQSGKYPIWTWADQNGKRNYARENNSLFIYKGDYLAFREITLSYQLPELWLNKVFVKSAEFSVTAQNLGYLTAAKTLYSPEYGANSQGGYSLPRSVIFGINVSF